jgi:hypothetical protein
LEACTASLPPEAAELDVQREAAVAAAEPVVQQAAAVAAAEPDAQQEAAVAAEPDAQQAAAAAAAVELDAQQQAVAAVVEPDAQQQAAAMQWGVRPLLVSSVEFAATAVGQQRAASCSPMATMARQILAAAVRFWFRATSSLTRAPR